MARAMHLLSALVIATPFLWVQSSEPSRSSDMAGGVEVFILPLEGGRWQARAKAPPGTDWVVLFFRKDHELEFDTLVFQQEPDGVFAADFEGVLAQGVQFHYFIALRGFAGIQTYPAKAPSDFLTFEVPSVPGNAPVSVNSPTASPPVHGPIYVDLSATKLIHRKVINPNEPLLLASGQIRYAVRSDEDNRHWSLGTRLVYTNNAAPNQAKWSIGDIQASLGKGDHRLQAGDLMVQESEFTLGAGGRRGLDYAYAGRPFSTHLFALNTQRQAGVGGLVWPVDRSEAYGGSLNYFWFGNALKTRLIFVTGRDDPSTAANVVMAFAAPVREGSTGSLVVDGQFLENRLAVSGEYARSLYSHDALVGEPKKSDQAWRFASQWNQGPLSAQAGYRAVGPDFGTVGVAFFVGDRRVLDGNVGVNYLGWGLSASATDERTNPTGQTNLNQAVNQTQSLDARWVISAAASWRVGLRTARQASEIVANPFIPFSNSVRSGLTTGLDLALPPRVSLTVNAQFDRLRSTGYSTNTGTATTLSMGGNLGVSTWGRLSPNLSWSRILSQPGDQQTTVSNAFLNAEFGFIPRVLGLLVTGGVSRTILATGEILTTATAEGTLGLTLDSFFKNRARGNLGVKARYTRNPIFAGIVEDNRVFLILNISY